MVFAGKQGQGARPHRVRVGIGRRERRTPHGGGVRRLSGADHPGADRRRGSDRRPGRLHRSRARRAALLAGSARARRGPRGPRRRRRTTPAPGRVQRRRLRPRRLRVGGARAGVPGGAARRHGGLRRSRGRPQRLLRELETERRRPRWAEGGSAAHRWRAEGEPGSAGRQEEPVGGSRRRVHRRGARLQDHISSQEMDRSLMREGIEASHLHLNRLLLQYM